MNKIDKYQAGQDFDLNDALHQSNVSNINSTRRRFVLPASSDYQHSSIAIEVPSGWEDSKIANLVLEYLYGPHFGGMTDRTKLGQIRHLLKFFDFISTLNPVYSNDEAIIYPRYHKYLAKKYKEYGAFKTFLGIRKILTWAKDQDAFGDKPNYWTETTKNILNRIPDLPTPKSEGKKTVSQVMNRDDIDDDKLFTSIRHYSVYFLSKYNDIRNFIRTFDPCLVDELKEVIKAEGVEYPGISKPVKQFSFQSKETLKGTAWSSKVMHSLLPRLIRALAALPENDLLFLPRLMMDSNKSESKWSKLLETGLMPTAVEIIEFFSSIEFEQKKMIFPSFSFSEIFSPTTSEIIAMSHLLSSERIQPSGLISLKLSNCKLTPKSVQICDYQKNRANKGFDTALYRSNTPIYLVYSQWIKLLEDYYRLSEHKRNGFFLPITSTSISHLMKKLTINNIDWFAPLVFDSTARSIVLNECPEARIFSDSMFGNISVKVNGSSGQKVMVIAPRPSLDSVAQSRVFIDIMPIDRPNSHVSDEIGAELTAHSLETKINTYKDRTSSNNVVSAGKKFSADVADFMSDLAGEAASLLNKTSIVTIEEIEERIGYVRGSKGYATDINNLLYRADTQGYEIGLIGDITSQGQTFVICTPLVAGLIHGEIEHIENSISKVEVENPGRVKVHQTRLLYLRMIIENFDSSVSAEGKALLRKYNFPYPPLS